MTKTKAQYRPDLGKAKPETEKLQAMFNDLGLKLSEGETAAEAVRFTLILSSILLSEENVLDWREMRDKIVIKLLE